jgi:hypothetical protein
MNNTTNVKNAKILLSYRKFFKLAHSIRWYNFREYVERKLRNDFREGNKNFDENMSFQKYHELQRIIIVQNLYSDKTVTEQKYCEY